jgi:hypothetical protein
MNDTLHIIIALALPISKISRKSSHSGQSFFHSMPIIILKAMAAKTDMQSTKIIIFRYRHTYAQQEAKIDPLSGLLSGQH